MRRVATKKKEHRMHQTEIRPVPSRPARAVTGAAVRVAIAGGDLRDRLADAVARRVRRAAADDTGSMTAEYAMVGGVGAAAAGAFIACLKNQDVIESVLRAVVSSVIRSIRGWF
jgi:hypothetical protein